jgi:peptidyl-Asp metalloendopeptidase
VEMSEDRMPPEHAPMPSRLRINDPNLRDDPLVHQGDGSMLRSLIAGLPPASGRRSQAEDKNQQDPPAAKPGAAGSAMTMGAAASPKDIIINVIVAYTKKAASNYADVGRELVEFAIEEANQSFRNSNLGHVKLKLVHAYQTDYVEDGEHFNHLWRFADKGDGYMEEIHCLRDKYDADVAVLIVNDAKGCGLATRVFSDANDAFAVVHHECARWRAAPLRTRLVTSSAPVTSWRWTKQCRRFHTATATSTEPSGGDIMSYKASCRGCPRLPVWSSPMLFVRANRPAQRFKTMHA